MIHEILKDKKIILASSSPRRSEILRMLGLSFQIEPANIDETVHNKDNVNPKRYVINMASQKCEEVYSKVKEIDVIIAADTIVYVNKKILDTPETNDEAIYYLRRLSGKIHFVYTGLAVLHNNEILKDYTKTEVSFKKLSSTEIESYLETNEPFDKAGAYGIQGYGSQFIERINGCYFNVMGFPVNLFYNLLLKI